MLCSRYASEWYRRRIVSRLILTLVILVASLGFACSGGANTNPPAPASIQLNPASSLNSPYHIGSCLCGPTVTLTATESGYNGSFTVASTQTLSEARQPLDICVDPWRIAPSGPNTFGVTLGANGGIDRCRLEFKVVIADKLGQTEAAYFAL
jgi:hypothetical protein